MSQTEQIQPEEQEQGNTLRIAFEATKDMDAPKAARVSQLSKSLGFPEGFVIENQHKAARELTARQIEENKLFAMWAVEDATNAPFARDDAEPLGGVFSYVADTFNAWGDSLDRAYDRGVGNVRVAWLGLRYDAGDDSALEEIDKARKEADPFFEQDRYGLLRPGTVELALPDSPEADGQASPPYVFQVAGGKTVLLPRTDEAGTPLTQEQAFARFEKDHVHQGIFDNPMAANAFLSLSEERRQEIVANWKQKPEETWIDAALGPGKGVEQIPMQLAMFPQQVYGAATGALLGGITSGGTALALGQAGPLAAIPEEVITLGPSVLTGMAVGGKTGWLTATAVESYKLEKGGFIADLATEKDANGNRLPREVLSAAADIYGFMAAAIEVGGEALFLRLLKPLGAGDMYARFGRDGLKGFLRSQIKRAAFDKNVQAKILDVGARLGLNTFSEGIEEGLQEAASILMGFTAKNYADASHGTAFMSRELFTAEHGERIREAVTGGIAAGFWLGSGPIMVSGALDIQSARQANAYAQQHLDLHAKVEATGTKQLSPTHMQSALEAAGPAMLERVEIPADAALELYQSGTDILSPLGITEQEAVSAAGQGQAFTVPVSRMHAFFDQRQFEAAAQIMRRGPDAISVTEAAQLDDRLAANAAKVIELYQEQAAELDILTQERERLHAQARDAINAVPGLKSQVEALAGGVDGYVNTWLDTMEKFALRMTSTGQSPAEVFRRVSLQARTRLARQAKGQEAAIPLTEEQMLAELEAYEQMMLREVERETRHESLLSKVRGRLDGKSLKRDYPDAYREIVRQHGPVIFRSAERGGIPLDYLAAELVESNVLEAGMGADELLERLKQPRGQLFQQGARGSVTIHSEGYLVNLFRGADLSTLLHETGHVFFEEMEQAVQSGIADQTMIDDYGTLRTWVGAGEHTTLTTPQREQLARGFEAYLMEGKAPSRELESVFEQFKKWLLTVYKSAKRLRVELNDDVRGVFDRMLSTEREVAATAARNELIDLTQKELDALGIIGPAREFAGKLMTAARETAAQRLEQDRNRERKQRLGQYAKEAREELLELMVYQARSDIRKTPLDAATVRELYGEDSAKALRKALPFGLKEEGGVDPEIFAAEHGFASGQNMVAQIIDSPSLGKAIAERVREKEARHDAMFPSVDYLLETAQANEQVAMVGKYLAQNLGRQHVQQEAFTRVAEQELAGMALGKAMQTGNFLAAMRRALRQERLAIGQGDFTAALEANHKARLNMEFARQSREIARTQGVMQRLVNRFIGMSKADPDARYIVMDVGMRHGMNTYKERLGAGRDVRTTQEWMRQAEEDGYTIYADDRILYGPGTPWREMTLTDFETLSEVVRQIVTVERNRRKLLTAQGKAGLDKVADGVANSIYEHRSPKAVKTVEGQPAAVKALKNLHAIHMKVEAICIALDGDTRGPTWEAIYLPIANADDARSMRFKEVTKALRGSSLFGAYTRKELAGMGSKKELVREVGENLTWENRISLALNMGNETNISRIKDGHNWNDEQVAAVLRPLTRRDWEFVQGVWDYLGSFKEEAFALQEEITGMRPLSVEAKSFVVQSADGATLSLRGGYYPIKYNSEKGFRAYMQEQKVMDKELFGGRNHGAAMTKNGHLKERAAGGMGSPLLLELSVITDHLFNVVHDITHRKAVLDVAKVIKHKTVREAIEGTVGQEMYRQLMPWLQDVANERQEPMHAVHRWARWARASSSIMQMGYKITTMLAQPLGYTQSIEVLGYKWAARGIKRVYPNFLKIPELLEETFARSSFMANRIKSFDREVRDMTKQLKPGMGRFAWVDKVKENAFVPMGVFQMGVDLPTWWGAYEKGLEDYKGNETRAAQYADSVVRMSQGSGSTKDLARVQRGGDLLRLTTMFYSYFNTLYNLGARGTTALKNDHSPAGIFRAANTALLLWFVPAVLSELFAGREPDEDDDEGWGEWAALNVIQYPFQSVVGVRDITNAIFGEYGYQITPAQAAPKSIVNWFKAVNKAMEEEDAGKLVKATAEAGGYLFGLPMKQPIITIGNLWDYITGEDPELYARDLFFVKPKSRR